MIQSFAGSMAALLVGILLQSTTSWPINFFLAPLILLMYTAQSGFCYWTAFLCGLFLDCTYLSPRFGFFGVTLLVAFRLLYPWRLYFFKDYLSTLPVMTYLLGMLTGLISCFVALIIDLPSPLSSLRWFISDVFIMPLLDVVWGVLACMVVPHLAKTLIRLRKA